MAASGYAMLATVRNHASARLRAAGDRDAAVVRHALYFVEQSFDPATTERPELTGIVDRFRDANDARGQTLHLMALMKLSARSHFHGGVRAPIDQLHIALRQGSALVEHVTRRRGWWALAITLEDAGHLPAAVKAHRRSLELALAAGVAEQIGFSAASLALTLIADDRPEQAIVDLDAVRPLVPLNTTPGSVQFWVSLAYAQLCGDSVTGAQATMQRIAGCLDTGVPPAAYAEVTALAATQDRDALALLHAALSASTRPRQRVARSLAIATRLLDSDPGRALVVLHGVEHLLMGMGADLVYTHAATVALAQLADGQTAQVAAWPGSCGAQTERILRLATHIAQLIRHPQQILSASLFLQQEGHRVLPWMWPARDWLARLVSARGLQVGPEARWISLGAGPRLQLALKHTTRRVLVALVDRRLSAPGVGIPPDELFELGWPDERVNSASALNRLRVVLSGLRKAGLGDVIEHVADGYRLDPDVLMERVES
ncbi:MAG: hypothetical protein ACI9MC_002696 [Kiritimatiellia bacterium]